MSRIFLGSEIEEKLWIRKLTPIVVDLNRLLVEMARNDIFPEIWIIQDDELLGNNIQVIEVTISDNPHYSDWVKLHVDFCRRYPKSSAFQKLWFPTMVVVKGSMKMWWHCNVYARFWNSRFRFWLGLKHWSDGDC